METLVRVHNTPHGAGFITDQGSQLNVSDRGDVTTDKFLAFAILQQIDPDPRTSSIAIREQALWLHLDHPQYVGSIRLMTIPDHLVDQATAAVYTCLQRLAKRARKNG